MESQATYVDFGDVVDVTPAIGAPQVVVVCEHSSNRMPAGLDDLGLSGDALTSHVAWDPGALGVAQGLAGHLNAVLVSGGVSRLVYDCNRPPEADSAVPARSEVHDIPGNRSLSKAARAERVSGVYEPFRKTLAEQINRHRASLGLMVTVHSFTPVYNGQPREVEIGLLHGRDTRFCRAMLANTPDDIGHNVRLNEPYAAVDGVAHTLDEHGAANDLQNVMIEIRNDLIQRPEQQAGMAILLADWISNTRRATEPET
ncbi:MAG: N-formylglutamate amidohydrolase [Paracoccaceae bacterium]